MDDNPEIDPNLHHDDCEAFVRHNRYVSSFWHTKLNTFYPKLYKLYRFGWTPLCKSSEKEQKFKLESQTIKRF